MGLFDFMKKNPQQRPEKLKIEVNTHDPTREEMEQQWKNQTAEWIRNFQKDEAGLYPHEILMLSYLEGYCSGKDVARFWEREYGVDNVPALIKSLQKRGFAENGKLTELGKAEIEKNEYVPYMHRHKNLGISMADMSILVNKNPSRPYRDLLWAEFNRLSGEYVEAGKIGLYRNVRYAMYAFLVEEKRYKHAFVFLVEVFFFDLNEDNGPFLASRLIKNFQDLERQTDYTEEEIKKETVRVLNGLKPLCKNFSIDDITSIIVAYSFGHNEIAENIFNQHAK